MKAVLLQHYGPASDALKLVDAPIPQPGPGELLVEVEAAGVNFADIIRRAGGPYPTPSRPPYVLGAEVVGRVMESGDGAGQSWVGRRVYASMDHGGYAQFAVVPSHRAVAVSEDLDATRLVALGVQGMTALAVLRDAGALKQGEAVYIEAAAGGVGSFAVQLARHFGAGRVLGSVSNEAKAGIVSGLGATPVINMGGDWWQPILAEADGPPVDLVLQCSGGNKVAESVKLLRPYGRMIIYGLTPPAEGPAESILPTAEIMGKQITLGGFYLEYYLSRPGYAEEAISELTELVKTGAIKVDVFGEFPLEDAAHVHGLIESRTTNGKLVLIPKN